MDKTEPGFCAETHEIALGNRAAEVKCDLYDSHGGRHRTVLTSKITIFWEK